MKYDIKITQQDLDQGEPCTFCRCPVAIAINRETGFFASAGYDRIILRDKDPDNGYALITHEVMTPDAVCAFISQYDSRQTRPDLTPWEFPLEIPN